MAAAVASSCCASTSARPLVRRAGSRSGKLWWAGGGRKARLLSISATAAAPSGVDYAAGTGAADDDAVAALKVKLLVSVLRPRHGCLVGLSVFEFRGLINFWAQSAVSGLNRGLAASQEDLDRADAAARELEAAADGGPVDLEGDMDKLQGRWRLVYSSAFSSRTLGGSRPGPPTGRLLPITLGQVRKQLILNDFGEIRA